MRSMTEARVHDGGVLMHAGDGLRPRLMPRVSETRG
jgi:hypothetical protein